jgi:hypothetical protein
MFSTNKNRKNVVGKKSFSVAFRPVSLSLTSLCLDLCLSRGGGGRVTRPPLAFASGLRVHLYIRGGLFRREGSLHIYLFIGGPSAGGHDIGWRRVPERCVLAAARSEQPRWLVGTVSGPYPFGLLFHDGLRGFGRTSAVLADGGRQPSAQTSGALIVTLVTIKGAASCPEARPGPNKPTGRTTRGAGGANPWVQSGSTWTHWNSIRGSDVDVNWI